MNGESALTTRNVLDYSSLATVTDINIREDVMTTQGIQATNQRFREIQGKVREWLNDERWRIRDERAPDAAWALSAQDEQGRVILVGQRTDNPNRVVIQGAVITGDQVKAKLQELTPTERQDFYHGIQFALLGIGVEYIGIGEPFERPEVLNRIYHDGLTRDAFIQRVMQVKNGVVLLLGKIGQLMNQEPPPAPTQTPIGFRGPGT